MLRGYSLEGEGWCRLTHWHGLDRKNSFQVISSVTHAKIKAYKCPNICIWLSVHVANLILEAKPPPHFSKVVYTPAVHNIVSSSRQSVLGVVCMSAEFFTRSCPAGQEDLSV